MFELLTFFQPKALHDLRHAISGAEVAHQIILEADVKPRGPGIALACATSTQLPIDTTGFVAFRADDIKSAPFENAGPEFNVGAAPRHVGGDRDCSRLAGASYDFRFLHVV